MMLGSTGKSTTLPEETAFAEENDADTIKINGYSTMSVNRITNA